MREVEARLKISAIDRTGNVLSKVGKQMADVNRRAMELNRQQTLMAKSTTAAYAALARYAAPAVLAYGVKESLVQFADVERQMSRIGITAGATQEETATAFAEMRNAAKEMAMPLDQAMRGLDTLVSSGMSLKDAMAFLPAVLATAQASGAATEDIANTAIKAASALKLEAGEMQRAFDVMVAGGKAGQFELKDMAQYIPDLANSFASLGYEGEEGLKKLIALLQTVREDTGTAESAATNLQNIFGKIYSEDTAKKFRDMGVDLNAELAKARKNGEDTVAAFVRISQEAIKGDLTKLPKLFTDQQFRLGMQSLMTSADSYAKFLKVVNSSEVKGTVLKDLQRITGDTQASIDRLSSSWERLMNSVGKAAARPLVPAMDAVSNDLDYGEALRAGLEKQGMDYMQREWWIARNLPLGAFSQSAAADKAAIAGGYKDEALRAKYMQGPKLPYGWKSPVKAGHPDLSGDAGKTSDVGVPREKPSREVMLAREYARAGDFGRSFQSDAERVAKGETDLNAFYGGGDNAAQRARIARKQALRERRAGMAADERRAEFQSARDGDVAPRFSLIKAMRMDTRYGGTIKDQPDVRTAESDMRAVATTLEDGSKKIADGGETGGKAIVQAGEQFAAILSQAARSLAATLGAVKVAAPMPVNANTGRTNDFVKNPSSLMGPR